MRKISFLGISTTATTTTPKYHGSNPSDADVVIDISRGSFDCFHLTAFNLSGIQAGTHNQ
jgi:hypothetical protein